MMDAEQSQLELERRMFHLKTLYEVSQLIGSLRDTLQIMKNLLMMVVGTFGALKGVALLVDTQQWKVTAAAQRSIGEAALQALLQAIEAGYFAELKGIADIQTLHAGEMLQRSEKKFFHMLAAAEIQLWIPFAVHENVKGGIGLGAKMLGEPYTLDDQELLSTLGNQLTVALDNALAYMEIHQLNVGLEAKVQERTAELKTANEQLDLHNRFIRDTFGRYVSDEVVTRLLESPTGLELGGEKRQVTVLMSDLRGFTPLAERLAPEQVVGIINRYLGAMVDVILRYGGTINEFIGDAILVLFGAPVRRQDDARQAVACAVAMQLAMEAVNDENRQVGLPEVEMGIGVHTGEVVVGNIGSHKRMKYGVVGRHVNLTSRIESYTVGGQILISESTQHAVGPILRVAGHMQVEPKGVEQPLTLYDVRGIGGSYDVFLPVEGKHSGDSMHTGRLVRLSVKGGEMLAEMPIAPWRNLKIQLIDRDGRVIPSDLYAKVMDGPPQGLSGCYVRFTSVPPGVAAFLRQVLGVSAA
jgi:class 3 adenylate cyclase